MKNAQKTDILKKLDLNGEEYAAFTLHRPENVDVPHRLQRIIRALAMLKDLTIVFPVHPRTKQRLAEVNLMRHKAMVKHIKFIEPVGYEEMLQLTKHARMIFTDSGGLQKEAFWLHTPCITLRDKIEWSETVELGANIVVGDNPQKIVKVAKEVMKARDAKARLRELKNPFGDGEASQKIVRCILRRR